MNEAPPMSIAPDYKGLVALCRRFEEIGFGSAWLMDHFTWGPDDAVFECWTTLSALSRETSKIHLGPFFLCTGYRNPALVAKMAATLDVISGGRLELGLGAGWKEDEYRAYGYDFDPPKVRIAKLDEAASIVKVMWTGRPVTFRGRYYNVSEAVCRPRPIQPNGPNLWIGGGGERFTLRVAAKHADACNFSGLSTSLEDFRRKLSILERHCRSVGRRSGEIVKSVTLEIILGKDDDEARRRERQAPNSRSSQTRFVGTPSHCISLLQEFMDSGVTYFMIHAEDLLSSLDLFEKDVLPSFR